MAVSIVCCMYVHLDCVVFVVPIYDVQTGAVTVEVWVSFQASAYGIYRDKLALRWVFLQVLWFCSVAHFTNTLYSCVFHLPSALLDPSS
jgi:hypothetical protein